MRLCKGVSHLFEAEPRCVFLQSPVYVFGDIHGNLEVRKISVCCMTDGLGLGTRVATPKAPMSVRAVWNGLMVGEEREKVCYSRQEAILRTLDARYGLLTVGLCVWIALQTGVFYGKKIQPLLDVGQCSRCTDGCTWHQSLCKQNTHAGCLNFVCLVG